MTTGALALLLAASAYAAPPSLSGAKRWACFYGAQLSSEAWHSLDLVIVDPDNYTGPLSSGPLRLAYVSAGEADERRLSWDRVAGKPYVIEPNPEWPSAHRVDLRDPAWRAEVGLAVSSAMAKGYDGVFLDTMDVAEYLESSAPARFIGSVDAAAGLLIELRAKHPSALILLNNGLALLEKGGGAIDGVMVEDLYTRCMPGTTPCGPSPKSESRAKEERLLRFSKRTRKPVFVFLYSRLGERSARWVRRAVARGKKLGFFSYLSSPTLDRLGLVDPAR
ncbi:MAG: endo alpha-1,4 polygalactosaminidase [Elusimicrobia bacterium]|nr:endo alpha-1,4 polygalactosaminidase [Elusimicrobiota bacterium]